MESDSHALKTGLFLVAALALLAMTLAVFGDRETPSRSYVIYTTESVAGLAADSRVYYKGVEVGRVRDVGFDGEDYDRVMLSIAVDERIPLGENTYAQLQLRGITGEYDLTLDNDGPLGQALTAGPNGPPEIPMRTQYMVRLGEAVEQALGEVERLATSLRELTEGDNRDRFGEILDGAADAIERFSELEEKLGAAADRLPATLDALPGAIEEFGTAMNELGIAARNLTERTAGLDPLIATMTRATLSLDRLLLAMEGDTLTDVDETLDSLRLALRQLAELADALRRDPQSLLLGAPQPPLGPGEGDER